MDATEPEKVFVRNDQGKVWGPLALSTVELLIDSGMLQGRLQVSRDGVNFAFPGRFPGIRRAFPRELWGEVVAPGDDGLPLAPAPLAPAVLTPDFQPPPVAAPPASHSAPAAGPGAVAAAQARHRPLGDSARTAATPEPRPPPAATAGGGSDLPPASGVLGELSPVHLYYRVAAGAHTGLLTLCLPDRKIELHFRKGNPEHLASSHPEDSVAGFLLKEGLASAEQIARAEAESGRFGGELLAALFGLNILNPGTAFSRLMQWAGSLLERALRAEQGRFTFEACELPSQKSLPLGNRWAVLTEQVRRIPVPEMKRRLSAVMELPVMKSGGEVAPSELRLTPQETRVLSRIDGVRSVSQLCRDFPQETDPLVRVVFLLKELEAVSFAQVPQPAPPPPPPPPEKPVQTAAPPRLAPAVPPVAPPVVPPTVSPVPKVAQPLTTPRVAKISAAASPKSALPPEVELAQLGATLAKLKDQNHFEVLGLSQSAEVAQVKSAYFKLAKLYHPDTVPGDAPAELGRLKADIFSRVGEAYRTLSDEQSRQRYLEDLKSGGGAGVEVASILAAEEKFQKGCILVKARKFPEAVAMLDAAIQANPEEGEFYAWRGYAKFFLKEDRSAGLSEALQDIQLCLKKNERCAQAYYFQGHMAKLCNDSSGAARHFKKCVELKADHVEAQRELRLMKK